MKIKKTQQNNSLVTDEIVISSIEPSGSNRKKVWFQKGKNLFNGQIVNGYGLNEDGTTYGGSSRAITGFIPISANSNYCFSGATFKMVCIYDEDKNFVSSLNGSLVNTFSAPSNAKYVRLAFDNTVDYSKLQVECGEEATEYEEYVNNAIYVKNDNGEYEEFIKKNMVRNSKVESTEETYSCDYINSSLEIEKIEGFFVVKPGYTILFDKIFKQGKHYFGNLIVKKNSGNFTNIQEEVATPSKTLNGNYNTGCFLTNDIYAAHAIGYCYFRENAILIADHNEKGYNFAKINVDIVVN